MIDDDVFARFLVEHDAALASIAHWSRGSSAQDDVVQEAWLLAFEQGAAQGCPVRLDLRDNALAFLKSLGARTRRQADRVLARASALERRPGEDSAAWTPADWLATDDGEHPLSLLEALESPAPAPSVDPYRSRLDALAALYRRLDASYARVAGFLMISRSWCYVCRRRARDEATAQVPLPALRGGDDETALQPWRRFKRPAPPPAAVDRQGTLDFWQRPRQPVAGQLWLI